jgi:hypothetical protein
MSTQDSLPMVAHESPARQPPGNGSPISSMSADENAAEHNVPLLDEARPAELGQHEQISPIERLPAVPYDRFSRAGPFRPEPAQIAQPIYKIQN